MSTEIDAQLRNHTWYLEPPAAHQNVVGNKWVFKLKYLPNGKIECYKSQLVAKGFHQQQGIDYSETFSHVIKSSTIRLVLKVAMARDWLIYQLYVNNAFLQGSLKEEVYLTQPLGFVDADRPHHVCRLRIAIYGLKQAPRAWYLELKTYLVSVGFCNSVADTSLFTLRHGNHFVYLLVYVDDILVTGSSSQLVQQTLDSPANHFSIKDPEPL